MIEVRWTLEAYENLKGSRDYIGRDSTVYARDVAFRRSDAVGVLATYPDSGRVSPERSDPSLRELVRAPYRTVYRRRPDVVESLAIFHGAQQFPSRFPSAAV